MLLSRNVLECLPGILPMFPQNFLGFFVERMLCFLGNSLLSRNFMSLSEILPGCIPGIPETPFCCFTRPLLPSCKSFWGGFPNIGVGKWLRWLHEGIFPFFSSTDFCVEVWLLRQPWGLLLAVFLSSLSLWRPQRCRFLLATAAFEPLFNSLPKWTPVYCLLRDLTMPGATCDNSGVKLSFVEMVLGPPRWCCEEQQCLLLCLSNKNCAEKVSLLPQHEAEVVACHSSHVQAAQIEWS